MLDDISKTLFLIECKSIQGTSIPLTMIRESQMLGLLEADKHSLIAGLLINFRNTNNDTFFISIDYFNQMVNNINKKSFNIKDLLENNAIKIQCTKKRTRYTYNIQEMIYKTQSIKENNREYKIKVK